MAIESVVRTLYRSSRASRYYQSKTAAIAAEARAIIADRHPAERAEYDSGHMIYPGSDWHGLPRSEVLYRRVVRMVRAAFLKSQSKDK